MVSPQPAAFALQLDIVFLVSLATQAVSEPQWSVRAAAAHLGGDGRHLAQPPEEGGQAAADEPGRLPDGGAHQAPQWALRFLHCPRDVRHRLR